MKQLLGLTLFVIHAGSLFGADDLEALVQKYEEVKATATRGGQGRSSAAARVAAPHLRAIAAVRTDESRRYLLREFGRVRGPLAKECAKALVGSGDPDALRLLLENFARQRPPVARAILDGLEWGVKRGRAAQKKAQKRQQAQKRKKNQKEKPPRKPKNGPAPVDLKPVAEELIRAARETRRPDLKARFLPLLGHVPSVGAASTILSLCAGKNTGKADMDELRANAVTALRTMGEEESVGRWLATGAFSEAKDDPGKLVVVAETVGHLHITAARRRLEQLLLHTSRAVGVVALEALSRLGKGIPSKAVSLAYAWLQREKSPVLRARILDSLARDGKSKAMSVILRVAHGKDTDARAIAVGSLALAREDAKALEGLLGRLEDPARDVRSAALLALRGVRHKAVIPALIELLAREREERLRVDALKILVELTGHNMGLVAADWNKWWSFEGKSFQFPEEREAGTTSVAAHGLEYFGIEISSRKMAFLLDVSLSMLPIARSQRKGRGKLRKIDLLKRELTALLEKLPPETLINIHVFDKNVRSWEQKLQRLGGGGLERATKYVRDVKTGGGTNIFDSIEIALADRDLDTIYLLTDGQPTTGRYRTPAGILKGTRDLNRTRAVRIHCIAFGAESELLRKLAAEHGGEYRFVDE